MTPCPLVARLSAALAALATAAAPAACASRMPDVPPAAPPAARPVAPAPPTASAPAPEDDALVLVGSVTHIVDGDTLKVRLSSGPVTVRLSAIDAPEHDQPGGAESMSALARRLEGRSVELEVEAQDQYERLVAFVHLGGESVNSWMVQQGYAWAYRRYLSDPRYCAWEADARTYRRGLWSAPPGSQKAPWEWRRAQHEDYAFKFTDYQRESASSCIRSMRKSVESRAASLAPQSLPAAVPPLVSPPAAGECRIKGNISGQGKVYHLPGSEWYERTEIDARKGERWFCTEAEARAAGWRAQRQSDATGNRD